MASAEYIIGRKTYQRPQALCFADSPGTTLGGMIVPEGLEFVNFIVLSDHNRSSIQLTPESIGTRKRAINGRLRSYFVAEKLSISTSWENLPSRGWPSSPELNESGVNIAAYSDRFTVDGGAGGNELLQWYKNFKGSFWVYLAYDRYPVQNSFTKLGEYNESIEVMFSDFSYDVVKRGATNMDLWNIDLKLEEV